MVLDWIHFNNHELRFNLLCTLTQVSRLSFYQMRSCRAGFQELMGGSFCLSKSLTLDLILDQFLDSETERGNELSNTNAGKELQLWGQRRRMKRWGGGMCVCLSRSAVHTFTNNQRSLQTVSAGLGPRWDTKTAFRTNRIRFFWRLNKLRRSWKENRDKNCWDDPRSCTRSGSEFQRPAVKPYVVEEDLFMYNQSENRELTGVY